MVKEISFSFIMEFFGYSIQEQTEGIIISGTSNPRPVTQ